MLFGTDSNVSTRTNTCLIEEKGVGLPQQERRSFESRLFTERKKQGLEVNKFVVGCRQV